jgi:hypothetical protein
MKRFNKVITIEVSVDSIAEQFLAAIDPEFKHRELLAEAAIATALEKGTLGYFYNALNGYSAEVNFKAGDKIICTEAKYFRKEPGGEDSRQQLGNCTVLEVNEYADNKLKVQYTSYTSGGSARQSEEWVKHTNCSKLQEEPVMEMDAKL